MKKVKYCMMQQMMQEKSFWNWIVSYVILINNLIIYNYKQKEIVELNANPEEKEMNKKINVFL